MFNREEPTIPAGLIYKPLENKIFIIEKRVVDQDLSPKALFSCVATSVDIP